MRTVNKIFLMGHLGAKPELSVSKGGRPYTRLSVATHRYQPNPEGKGGDTKSEWHSVFVWGDQAERCVQYLQKGACVWIEGSLTYWQVAFEADEKAADRSYKNAVHAESVNFITYGGRHLDNSPSARNHNPMTHPTAMSS